MVVQGLERRAQHRGNRQVEGELGRHARRQAERHAPHDGGGGPRDAGNHADALNQADEEGLRKRDVFEVLRALAAVGAGNKLNESGDEDQCGGDGKRHLFKRIKPLLEQQRQHDRRHHGERTA